ncbi:RNA-binding protein 34-like [Pyrus ussuriensis x Pyrus communis]|uniref:RNA-binding protein 34-like n=1 Tax=Pyrus ussuriensis x Pyrus communis TaxID=2448454 RepID=A0A5N5HGR5_9ROSA|nr:RNA-binding protein 34-like [Pyrus ussuriensis x Pyrus communis]
MGRKKPKEPESDAVSAAQSDVFKTLFGDAVSHDAAPAIFSDSNPFRRKNREPDQGFVAPSAEPAESINYVEPENNGDDGDGDVKKRKRRSKEKAASGSLNEEASEGPVELEGKKRKKKKLPETPDSEKPNLGSEFEGVSRRESDEASEKGNAPAKKKDGKKRKRDEVEREYEVKKYGVKEGEEDGDKEEKRTVGEKRKTVDNPADMLVSTEGFDDESKLLRTVFVGNLPLKVKKKALMKEFTKFGEVESVRIRSVPILDTKRPRKGAILTKQIHDKADSVNAYVVFKMEESAETSLSHNMAVVEGHHIRVDRACPPRKKLKGESATVYDHMRTVFVGNLPFDVKDEEVYQLFCGINNLGSSVEAIRIIRDPNYGIGKGIAYILFRTREAANLVVKRRNLKLGDRELRLSHAKPESTPTKRKNPSSAPEAKSSTKKRAVDSRSPDFNKSSSKASYQGLRAGKPGVQKKFNAKGSRPDKFESRFPSGVKPKERKDKRPSVAARKAKEALKGGAASKQIGTKRKLDSRSPDSSQQKKKFKKFR